MSFDDVRFAPAAVLRAAAWPAHELAELGEGPAVTEGLQDAEQRLARDRERLWQQLRDDEFLKALTVANPSFAARAARSAAGGATARRIKRQRHLETTIYRYWARAVGRATPADLWAGMTTASIGATTELTPRSPKRVFLPDLGAFRSLLTALGRQPAHRRSQVYFVNATLALSQTNARYGTRDAEGNAGMRELSCTPAMRAVLDALPRSPRPHGEIAASLAALGVDNAAGLVDTFVEQGLLVGGLGLPARFETVWQALERVELSGRERDTWQRAVAALSSASDRLQRDYDHLGPDDIAAELERARAVVVALREQLGGLDCKLPARLLRCDLRLGVDARLGPDLLGDLAQHHAAHCAAWGRGSPLAEHRDAFRARLRAFVDEHGGAISAAPQCSALHQRPARTWEALLATSQRELAPQWRTWLAGESDDGVAPTAPADTLGEPALGSLLLGLDPRQPSIIGTSSDVAGAFARHALTDDIEPLARWLAAELAASPETIVELVGSLFDVNSNAMARPELGVSPVTLWSTDADAAPLHDARLCFDDGRVRLQLADGRLASARSLSSASIAFGDPFATLALTSSERTRSAWNLPAALFPAQQELSTPRHRHALRCAHPAQLRPPRTVVTGDALRNMLRERGMPRFARWQQLARDLGWPRELDVIRDGAEPLRVIRDSPLAVEALLEGFSKEGVLLVSEARAPSLELEGGPVVAEVAISYARR